MKKNVEKMLENQFHIYFLFVGVYIQIEIKKKWIFCYKKMKKKTFFIFMKWYISTDYLCQFVHRYIFSTVNNKQ